MMGGAKDNELCKCGGLCPTCIDEDEKKEQRRIKREEHQALKKAQMGTWRSVKGDWFDAYSNFMHKFFNPNTPGMNKAKEIIGDVCGNFLPESDFFFFRPKAYPELLDQLKKASKGIENHKLALQNELTDYYNWRKSGSKTPFDTTSLDRAQYNIVQFCQLENKLKHQMYELKRSVHRQAYGDQPTTNMRQSRPVSPTPVTPSSKKQRVNERASSVPYSSRNRVINLSHAPGAVIHGKPDPEREQRGERSTIIQSYPDPSAPKVPVSPFHPDYVVPENDSLRDDVNFELMLTGSNLMVPTPSAVSIPASETLPAPVLIDEQHLKPYQRSRKRRSKSVVPVPSAPRFTSNIPPFMQTHNSFVNNTFNIMMNPLSTFPHMRPPPSAPANIDGWLSPPMIHAPEQ
jgi:hypothetical protein